MRKGTFKSKPRTPQVKKKSTQTRKKSSDATKSSTSVIEDKKQTELEDKERTEQKEKEKVDEKIPAEEDLEATKHDDKKERPEETKEKPADKPDKGKKKTCTNTPEFDQPDCGKPRILLVALYVGSEFDTYYAPFYNKLLSKASVQRANSPKPILHYLRRHKPQAIILLDAALAHRKEFSSVACRILRYVREGGTLICANTFNSYLAPFFNKTRPTLALFRLAGLSWEFGDVYTTYIGLNKKAVQREVRAVLPPDLTCDGILLSKVPSGEAWYLPSVESISDALAFDGRRPEPEWTSVAFARVEEGYFGYVGDLNVDGMCDAIIMAMSGLSIDIDFWMAVHDAENDMEGTNGEQSTVAQASQSKAGVSLGTASAS